MENERIKTFVTIIGKLSVCGTEDAVTAVYLPNENLPVMEEGSWEVTEEAAAEIGEYLAGGRKKFEVPYLQEGTSFRLDVWHALSEIPYGKTVTYTELAAAAGHPKAVRAAGSACAENRIPIIVPCHRVVPSAGGVGSYVGGSELKSRLLAIEKEQS
ncbi:MAG: methylated-DNA--[protein]-cysteine S-methyltransferase [Candidatus Methanomethylophilus sp.]|jgi:methylated-DNA-[protein]-cysteine S-methyltransferase|nr:methylated-DNA--[protein]-cysteine S-methyltransferase [Methanomethylophilus sp.]MCI2093472.1 methylated-DNA--[protein]-cysteine S-methyltransferase [Methanomethylophilus sp.]MEE3401313.1 methylated-DNA--[protein]-cysteine S-methyltransferase [Methanomethylophilus sp.]